VKVSKGIAPNPPVVDVIRETARTYAVYVNGEFQDRTSKANAEQPVGHECYVLPPKALALEMASDYNGAVEAIQGLK